MYTDLARTFSSQKWTKATDKKGDSAFTFDWFIGFTYSYTLYVVAMDQGVPALNSTTLHVNITLVDENDNNPKFEQAMYSVEVWENETIGGHVIQVKATERDSSLGSQIGYNISAGDPQGQFKIFYHSVSTYNNWLEKETGHYRAHCLAPGWPGWKSLIDSEILFT